MPMPTKPFISTVNNVDVLVFDAVVVAMVKIGDVDYQADGGTHVKNTSEIGKIIFLSADNKGKNNRRIYYRLE